MTDELKPCPFCGDPMEWNLSDHIRHVEQGNCPIVAMGFVSLAAWNTRTPPDPNEAPQGAPETIWASDDIQKGDEVCTALLFEPAELAYLPYTRADLHQAALARNEARDETYDKILAELARHAMCRGAESVVRTMKDNDDEWTL
jgi:hypothetical protein